MDDPRLDNIMMFYMDEMKKELPVCEHKKCKPRECYPVHNTRMRCVRIKAKIYVLRMLMGGVEYEPAIYEKKISSLLKGETE